MKPGESGLLVLDWHNGNRTILVDQRLTGLIVGLTLHSSPAEIYRALIEATAFGARVIMERYEEYGCTAKRIVNGGGIAAKNPVAMQIYADVDGPPAIGDTESSKHARWELQLPARWWREKASAVSTTLPMPSQPWPARPIAPSHRTLPPWRFTISFISCIAGCTIHLESPSTASRWVI